MSINPVLQRELRERMRGPRAVILLTGYLALLVGIFYFVYHAQAGGKTGVGASIAPTEVARIGRGIFEWVLFFMMLLVLFLVPGLTSGAIAGERERQTLIPMQVTMLKARSIVFGKIMASLAFLFLLVIATAPLFSLSYLIGGISLTQASKGLAVVVFTGVVLACLTAAASAAVRRVQTATVLAYGLVLVMIIATFLVYSAAGLLTSTSSTASKNDHPPAAILVANPLALTATVIAAEADQVDAGERTNSPFQPIRDLVEPLRRDDQAPAPDVKTTTTTAGPFTTTIPVAILDGKLQVGTTTPGTTPDKNLASVAGGGRPEPPSFAPFIESSMMLLAGLSIAAVWFAALRLRIPAEVER